MGTDFTVTLPVLSFVCLMVGLAGFVDASAGGGGIIALPAYVFTGMPTHFAYGCNKFSSACGTTLSVFKFWSAGAVNLRSSLLAAFSSFIGSGIAASIVLSIPDHVLKTMLLLILPLAAVVIFLKKDMGEEDRSHSLSGQAVLFLSLMIGFLVGGYDGMFGPGAGTFAIFAFSSIMKYDLKTASGNAKIVNLASNYASLLTFALAGTVYYQIAIPAGICNIIGNYIGSAYALKKGGKFIRPMMIVVLIFLLAKIAFDLFSI